MDHQHLESLYPEDCRFEEIEKLLGFIKEGSSCQLIGMPGVGRGNICKFLSYNHNLRVKHLGEEQTFYHFVFVNFAEVKNRPLFDIVKFIFLQMLVSLQERNILDVYDHLDSLFKKSLAYKDELVLFEGLKNAIDFLVHEKKLTVILLFERFETYVPLLTPEFFISLRSLRDRVKYRFSVVFSVTRPLEDSIESTILADFYEFFAGKNVFLSLSDKPGILFRIQYLEKLVHKKLPENMIKQLFTLTGGHGKLTRLATEKLLTEKELPEKRSLSVLLLEQKTIQASLEEIWKFLTPSEQEYVQQIAQNKDGKETFPFLEQIDLMHNQSLTIPLLQEYIVETKKEIATKKEIIMQDTAGIIYKGGTPISDRLTASEYRLLGFLIQNPNTIIDRETIIHVVWKETATTAGVTDQALDQLILRLRKKTETNPNNPQYLQTIKGRGLLFNTNGMLS